MPVFTTEVDAFEESFPAVKEVDVFDELFPTVEYFSTVTEVDVSDEPCFVTVSFSSVESSRIAKDVTAVLSNILGGSCDERFLLALTSASSSVQENFTAVLIGNLRLQQSCAGGFRICNNKIKTLDFFYLNRTFFTSDKCTYITVHQPLHTKNCKSSTTKLNQKCTLVHVFICSENNPYLIPYQTFQEMTNQFVCEDIKTNNFRRTFDLPA